MNQRLRRQCGADGLVTRSRDVGGEPWCLSALAHSRVTCFIVACDLFGVVLFFLYVSEQKGSVT